MAVVLAALTGVLLDNFWAALAVVAVAVECMIIALLWVLRGRRIIKMMEKMDKDGRDGPGGI